MIKLNALIKNPPVLKKIKEQEKQYVELSKRLEIIEERLNKN